MNKIYVCSGRRNYLADKLLPNPLGKLTALPSPLALLKGGTRKGWEERVCKGRGKKGGKGEREGKGSEILKRIANSNIMCANAWDSKSINNELYS